MAVLVLEEAHRLSVTAPIPVIASYLQELLTRRLLAYIARVKDGKTVARWAGGEVESVRLESEQRLRTAYEIAQFLSQFDSPQTVRAWFVGMNPQLGDEAPATAIHEGRFAEALSAARAFAAGG